MPIRSKVKKGRQRNKIRTVTTKSAHIQLDSTTLIKVSIKSFKFIYQTKHLWKKKKNIIKIILAAEKEETMVTEKIWHHKSSPKQRGRTVHWQADPAPTDARDRSCWHKDCRSQMRKMRKDETKWLQQRLEIVFMLPLIAMCIFVDNRFLDAFLDKETDGANSSKTA